MLCRRCQRIDRCVCCCLFHSSFKDPLFCEYTIFQSCMPDQVMSQPPSTPSNEKSVQTQENFLNSTSFKAFQSSLLVLVTKQCSIIIHYIDQ